LPQYTDIGTSPFGSEIELIYRSDEYLIGELISVNDTDIIVLNSANNSCLTIPKQQIIDYGIRFAQPKHYGIYIPTLTLSTISHGFIAMITLPINLITTIVVAVSSERAYTIDHKKITYEQLKMYARFPQGIPEGLGLDLIKK
jgi:hypothetical protein